MDRYIVVAMPSDLSETLSEARLIVDTSVSPAPVIAIVDSSVAYDVATAMNASV